MKHYIRDLLILCVYYTGMVFLYKTFLLRRGPLVRIVVFHDVEDQDWFRKVVEMLVSNFNIITPQQFHRKEFNQSKINILLSFDDGYESWVTNCLPVLDEYNCKGLFFINSGLLDIAHNTDAVEYFMRNRLFITPKRPLTWIDARKIVSHGHTIGGHTVNHISLTKLSPEELKREILNDKERIEQELGIVLLDFAHPFGTKDDFNDAVTDVVLSSGYQYQYSGISKFYNDSNATVVPRTLIEKGSSPAHLFIWIDGGYDILTMARDKIYYGV